jgi:hypothetical protein
MADVLRVDVAELTAPAGGAWDARDSWTSGGSGDAGCGGSGSGGDGSRAEAPAAAIERAMMRYDAVGTSIAGGEPDGRPGDAEYLRARARSAYQRYQATCYDDTGRILPGLIREAEISSRAAGPDDPGMCGARVLVYDTAAAMLNRVGEPTLAWMAADRAMAAARQSGRPELIALTAWRLSYVLGSRGYPAEALDLAMSAACALEPAMASADEGGLSVYGALHLAAATAAAAVFDRGLTASLLGKAAAIAERTGDGNWMGTAFGPANVAIHSISAALQFGNPRSAIDTGEALDAGTLPAGCTGRRAQLSLDLARAYSMRRQDAAAVNQLLAAERLSPQLVRCDTRTRDVLATLLRREHQPSTPELRPLARRAGVI